MGLSWAKIKFEFNRCFGKISHASTDAFKWTNTTKINLRIIFRRRILVMWSILLSRLADTYKWTRLKMLLSELMNIWTDEDIGSVISLSRKADHVGVLLSYDVKTFLWTPGANPYKVLKQSRDFCVNLSTGLLGRIDWKSRKIWLEFHALLSHFAYDIVNPALYSYFCFSFLSFSRKNMLCSLSI